MSALLKIKTPNGEATLDAMLDGCVVFYPTSTAIDHLVYIGSNKTLSVYYKSSPKDTYFYYGVEFPTVIELLGADSVGSFIAKQIKPNYEWGKYSD